MSLRIRSQSSKGEPLVGGVIIRETASNLECSPAQQPSLHSLHSGQESFNGSLYGI